jgi:UDP-N-acetylglucosamine 2-epimerase
MADSLRHMRERHPELTAQMHFITNVPAEKFVALLAHTACLVGNSSAGIKECSFLGTPVVNIGARQQGRLSADHVTHAGYDATDIAAAIAVQLAHGRYESSPIYYRPNTSQAIVDVLAGAELYTQKRFFDGA